MEKLDAFINDLLNNRYAGFNERVPDVKKEYLHLMSVLGANTGTSPYSNLYKILGFAEDCKLQMMVRYKVDAITEYRQLKEDYERLQNSPRKGNAKVPSQSQSQGKHLDTRQEPPKKDHSKSQPSTKANQKQAASKSPAKDHYSTNNSQNKGTHGETRAYSQSPTKKPQEGKITPRADIIRKQEEEIENLRNRLSKFAGQKLHDGNPSIADLSDPMRPNKIAECFSELYDNDFTEAFNELSGRGIEEERAVKILNKILKNAYEYTLHTSEIQFTSLMLRFAQPREEDKFEIPEKMKEDLRRHTRNIQRESAQYAVPSLCKSFISSNKELNPDIIKMYAWRCVELTWYSNVQTPRLYLHWDDEGAIMGDHVKPYTKPGTVINYQVWPTLYLHIDGPVLLKGIVQPK